MQGLHIVFRYSCSLVVHERKVKLRNCIPLFCSLAEPVQGLCIILGNTFT